MDEKDLRIKFKQKHDELDKLQIRQKLLMILATQQNCEAGVCRRSKCCNNVVPLSSILREVEGARASTINFVTAAGSLRGRHDYVRIIIGLPQYRQSWAIWQSSIVLRRSNSY